MWGAAADLAAGLESTARGVAGSIAGASAGWLALGVILHLSNQLARGRGWYAVLRRACPDTPDLRRRDVLTVWVAGAGAGGGGSPRGRGPLPLRAARRRG